MIVRRFSSSSNASRSATKSRSRFINRTGTDAQGPNVVVLSYRLWKRRFAGDVQIIGKAISFDKELYTVIGVTGDNFRTEPEAQLWIPFHFNLNSVDKLQSFGVAARLKPGITLAQANAQLNAASEAARRDSTMPDPDFQFQLRKSSDAMVSYVRPSLLLLQGAVVLVPLIVCANLANLLLMRMTVRKREFAIRGAIGAGRGRILRQLIVESLLLCSPSSHRFAHLISCTDEILWGLRSYLLSLGLSYPSFIAISH